MAMYSVFLKIVYNAPMKIHVGRFCSSFLLSHFLRFTNKRILKIMMLYQLENSESKTRIKMADCERLREITREHYFELFTLPFLPFAEY